MKAICAGAGEVNYKIAEMLISEGHSVTFLDKDERALQNIKEHLDVMTIRGNITSAASLKESGAEDADILIASGTHDEVNMVACTIGEEMGIPLNVAKIFDPEYLTNKSSREVLKNRGVDFMVNPSKVIADEIENIIKFRYTFEAKLYNDEVLLAAFKATDRSALLHHLVKEINQANKIKIVMIASRKGIVEVPAPNRRIKYGDLIYFFTKKEDFPASYELFMYSKYENLKKVLVIGGEDSISLTNVLLSEKFQKSDFELTFVEQDKEKAKNLAQKVKNLVINEENINLVFLSSDAVLNSDSVIIQAGSDKERVSTAIIAKGFGGKYVVTSLKKMRHPKPYLKLGLDGLFNSNLVISNKILNYIYNHEIKKMDILHSGLGQGMHIKVSEDSKLKDITTEELSKKNIGIGMMLRDGEYFYPDGEEILRVDDEIFLVDLSSKAENIRTLLSKHRFNI